MKSFAICALVAAGVSAVPMAAPHHGHLHHKRDVVWVTETDVDIVTVPITKTVWVDGSAPTSSADTDAANNNNNNYHPHHQSSTLVQTTSAQPQPSSSASVAPVSSSSTSEYVAPTTTSSVYVAPTTTSSVYVAPITSTSEYSAPAYTPPASTYIAPTTTSEYSAPAYTPPESTYVAPTTTSAAASSAAPTGGAGASYVGDLTYYSPSVGLGSCGQQFEDSDNVVALDATMMDKSTDCFKEISISYGGKTINAKVVDTCPGCKGNAGLDLSPSLFASFLPTASGVIPQATWSWN